MTDETDLHDADDDWSDEESFDADEEPTGFAALVAPYVGYEVELSGSDPIVMRVSRPSTPESAAVLVDVHDDCVVVVDRENYTVIPNSRVVVSIPRAEWEDEEFIETS